MRSGFSLKLQINLILLVVALLTFVVVSSLISFNQYTKKINESREVMRSEADIVQNLIATKLYIENQRFENIGREQKNKKSYQIVELLRFKLYPAIANNIIYVLDTKNQVILINPDLEQFLGFDLSHMPFRQKNQDVSSAFQSVFSGRSVAAMVYPLPGGLLLVVEKDLLTILSEIDIFTKEFLIHGTTVFVMDQEGKATYHPDEELVRTRLNLAFELKQETKTVHGLIPVVYQKKRYYVYNQDLAMPAGWRVALAISSDFLMKTVIRTVLIQVLTLFLLCTFLALALGFFLNRFFSLPVKKIVTNLARHKIGQTEEVVPAADLGNVSEFQQIASSINQMAKVVNTSRQRLASILDSMEALVYVADMETYEILFINAYGRRLLGDIKGGICWQCIQNDQHGPCSFCTNKRLLNQDGQPAPVYAWEFQNKKTKTWYDCRDKAIQWIDGHLVRLAIATDITASKRAEQALQEQNQSMEKLVQERTQDLADKNKELETFTYSVSHDLKAPLRGIDGYSNLLLEDYADILDENGKKFLNNIRLAATQMNQLIIDLLAYSRMERRSIISQQIDLQPVIERIVEEKKHECEILKIKIILDLPKLMALADVESLSQVFGNLMDNAIKYTKSVSAPVIEIKGKETQTTCILMVKDNGIGFDMKYHDKIFEIFQRLHSDESFTGTGVGLAIAKKAVNRMHGRLYAESEPDKGTIFFLELPKTILESQHHEK